MCDAKENVPDMQTTPVHHDTSEQAKHRVHKRKNLRELIDVLIQRGRQGLTDFRAARK